MIHSLEDKIKELESALHKSELKIISLESELSTSKAWYKIAEEEMINLNEQIKELEKFKTEHTPLLSYLAIETACNASDFKNWLAIRDLEQQAKGAEDVIESVLGEPESLTSDALSIRYEFLDRAKQLREQAKGGDV